LFTHGGYIKCYTICAFMLNHMYYIVYHNWSRYMSLLIYYSQVLMNTRIFTLLWINKHRMYNNIIPQIFHFIQIFLICFHNCSFGDRRKRERENWKYVQTCVLRALVVTNTEKRFGQIGTEFTKLLQLCETSLISRNRYQLGKLSSLG
jgi:hypothetical protein